MLAKTIYSFRILRIQALSQLFYFFEFPRLCLKRLVNVTSDAVERLIVREPVLSAMGSHGQCRIGTLLPLGCVGPLYRSKH